MKSADFKGFLKVVAELSRSQIDRLLARVEEQKSRLDSLRSLREFEPTSCPRCLARSLVRNGRQAGMQRFLCRACGRTSSAVSGSPLARLTEKSKLAAYAGCMAEGLTLRKTAGKLGISVDRAFRWRHAFLTHPVAHQPAPVAGLLEIDETYFNSSRKGERGLPGARRHGGPGASVPVLVGRVRGQRLVFDHVLKTMSGPEIAAALKPCVDPETTLLSMDSHASFAGLGKALGVWTCSFNASRPDPLNPHHVQSVNSYHERLKTWVNRILRGVATKYLPRYLAWQRFRTWSSTPLPPNTYIGSALGLQLINVK